MSHEESNAPGDDLIIEPAAAPLSSTRARGVRGRAGPAQRRRFLQSARAPLAGGLLVALLAVAVFVLLLPQTVVDRARAALPAALTPQAEGPPPNGEQEPEAGRGAAAASGARSAQPPPFASLSLAEERRAAQAAITGFVDLQVRLEDERNARAWAGDALDAAKDHALAGDALFRQEDYAGANRKYAAAVAALRALLSDADRRFEAAMRDGAAALAALDEAAATEAFGRAAEIRPDDARVTDGRARAARVSELATLLFEADRATLRGKQDEAERLLKKARGIDAATPGLDRRFRALAAARASARRTALLSTAFAALERREYDAAHEGFNAVLAAHAGDPAAQAGLQQTEQWRRRAAIDDLRKAALTQLRDEDWEAALASYDEALGIDASLRFAKEGRQRLWARLALVRGMDRIIDDPPLLSSDEEFAAAQDLLLRAEADAEAEPSEKFTARLARLRAILDQAAAPVPLVLTSDGTTDVVIHKVRAMGTFARVELSLRPGRYVIVGSRDGCRDVRKEIILAADMGPVDIRCSERI